MKTTFLLLSLFLLLLCGCDKNSKDESLYKQKGTVIGYVNCTNEEESNIFGLCIVSETNDSLLAFNISPSSLDIDISKLNYGSHFLNVGHIALTYRYSNENEIKNNFSCPQNAMQPGFYPLENFSQVVVLGIKKIE
jgi:hypothetical protein